VLRSAESLAAHPDNALTGKPLGKRYIVTYALCEAWHCFGLILRFTGVKFQQSLPYYIGGFVMLFFFRTAGTGQLLDVLALEV